MERIGALAGLSALTFRRFFVVMVVGRLPGATMTALLASDIVTGSSTVWITAGIVVAVLLALGIAYRKRLESWLLRRADRGQAPDGPDGGLKERSLQ